MDAPEPDHWQPTPGSRQAEILDTVLHRGTVRVAELAEEFGVQPVTVRRDVAALSEAGLVRRVHGGVSALTKAGSNGSGTAARLAGKRVGTLVPSLEFYWPDVVRGVEEEAGRLGMQMTLRGSVYHAADERGDVQRLLDAGAGGLLLAPTVRGPAGELIREWLADSPVPVVLMERTAHVGSMRRPVESVVTDHAGGAAMAVHHLASLGHRRIGVALNKNSPHVDQIHQGWRSACQDLGLTTTGVADVVFPEPHDPEFNRRVDSVVDTALETGTTAVIVHSDQEAVRVMQSAEERDLSIPGDLSIVSYDDQVATLATPALSAVRPPRRSIGRTAMGLLAARIAEPDRAVHRVQVSPHLIVRGSSGPAPEN